MRMSHNMKLGGIIATLALAGAMSVPVFFHSASAAQLSNLSMTASSTARGAVSNYILRATTTNAVTAAQTITVTLDSAGANYAIGALVYSDITATGMTVVNACGGGSDEVTMTFGNNPDVITFTVCGGQTVPAGPKIISFTNNRITNPAAAGSYKIRVNATTDSGDTVVAILDQVTMTASVDATLLFTVAGVTSGGTINGETISTTSSATAIGFGLLASGTPVVAAQDLTVTTNAANGYVVTVHEDQNLTAGNGAKIHLFNNGAQTATPIAWVAPSATLGSVNTYGHIGLTSDDTDLNSNEFYSGSVIKWAGNYSATSTRTILSNSGPADGTTQNIGKARVGYKIQVTALQAAASDYGNHLIYVCTPTF